MLIFILTLPDRGWLHDGCTQQPRPATAGTATNSGKRPVSDRWRYRCQSDAAPTRQLDHRGLRWRDCRYREHAWASAARIRGMFRPAWPDRYACPSAAGQRLEADALGGAALSPARRDDPSRGR